MKVTNPSGRRLRLDLAIAGTEDAQLPIYLGPGATVDLTRYEKALEALRDAINEETPEDQRLANQQELPND
jgi:hypothetical protein